MNSYQEHETDKEYFKEECPTCNEELTESTFSEDGEEYQCSKCDKCGYWGSIK